MLWSWTKRVAQGRLPSGGSRKAQAGRGSRRGGAWGMVPPPVRWRATSSGGGHSRRGGGGRKRGPVGPPVPPQPLPRTSPGPLPGPGGEDLGRTSARGGGLRAGASRACSKFKARGLVSAALCRAGRPGMMGPGMGGESHRKDPVIPGGPQGGFADCRGALPAESGCGPEERPPHSPLRERPGTWMCRRPPCGPGCGGAATRFRGVLGGSGRRP